MLGLKVNLNKSELIPVGRVDDIDNLASFLTLMSYHGILWIFLKFWLSKLACYSFYVGPTGFSSLVVQFEIFSKFLPGQLFLFFT